MCILGGGSVGSSGRVDGVFAADRYTKAVRPDQRVQSGVGLSSRLV